MSIRYAHILTVLLLLVAVRPSYANVSAADVVVANTVKGGVSQYNVTFTTTVDLVKSVDDVIVTFPGGTNPNAIKKKDVKINGDGVKDMTQSGQTFTIRVKRDISAGSITVQFRDPPGVINPLTAGSYTLDVSTSKEPTIVTSNSYTITDSAVLTSATVAPFSSLAGSAVTGYNLQFVLGGAGSLTAGNGTFTIVFPNDTSVPDGLIYGTTLNGTPATAIGISGTRTVQVETPVNLANLAFVAIELTAASGMVNPTVPATYTITTATSAETTPVVSNAYTIFDGTTLSSATVDVVPNTVNTASEYTVSARLGASGGLTNGTDEIYLDFPDNTLVPAAIATNDVLVDNGTYAANPTSITTVPATGKIAITPGQDIPDAAQISVVLKVEAGVVNPILTGNHTLDMATSKEDTVTSNAYLTLAAITTTTPANVALTDTRRGKVSRYTLDFNVGGQGRLLVGTSTISVVFPAGTDVPASITSSNVTVNGVASAGVTTNPATNLVTVTVPSGVSISNDGPVTLIIGTSTDVIKNPNSNVTTALQVSTSVEQTQTSSTTYQIGTGGTNASFDSINFGVSTVNTVSGVSIFFSPGSDIEAGDHVILTFPTNTTVPGSIGTSDIEITPSGLATESAQSVTTNPSVRQIDLEVPAKLKKNISHEIEILSGAGLINPSVPKTTYVMTLRTSDESTDILSPQYTITASATAVSVGVVTLSPSRAGDVGSYTIPVTLGSVGALLLGNSTITITFPTGTTIPAFIPTSTVTINGDIATTVTANPGSRTVIITTPASVASNGSATINLAVAAGIVNPAAGNHTLQVHTIAETVDGVSSVYATTSNTALAVSSALPNPSAINANAGYVVLFQIGSVSPLAIGDQITVDFDDNIGVPPLMAAGDVRVNNVTATATPFTDVISKKVVVNTPVAVAGNGEIALSFTNAAGLTNPPATGSYTLTVATNHQPAPVASPSYSITLATTSVSNASVTPSFGTVGQLSTYTLTFNVGAEGALQAGISTIAAVFDDSTTLGAILPNNVTINGVQTQTVMKTGQTVTVTVPAGVNIGNHGEVTLVIGSATAVITNPATAGNYSGIVYTSVETPPIPTLSYSIGAATTTVSPAIVTPSPKNIGAAAAYTVAFSAGAQGALTAGSSAITVTFPDNTTVPFTIAAGDITVNGTPVVVTPTISVTARSVTFTTPVSVANDGAVTVVFAAGAGLKNPSTGGTFSLQANTSVEVTKVPSQGYTIGPPTTNVVAANVTATPNNANTPAEYTVGFRVGAEGALQGGSSTITLTFPSGTIIPGSIATSKVTTNGTAVASVSVSGQEITLTVSTAVTIGNSDSVTIVIAEEALVRNPSIQGQHTLQVATNAEPTAVVSNPYTIGTATSSVTAATVTPVPATVSVTAAHTVDFNVGSAGGLQAGSSTITITFNASTTVATQTISGATVNGVSASGVADAGSRTVALTVPASVNVGNNGAVSVAIPSGVITNPVSGATYTLEVNTSVENTKVVSAGYLITTATTSVTAATVTPAPNTANGVAAYTFAFNVGAQGALTGGSSTIIVTFPVNTSLPPSITPGDVTVNGTPVAAAVVIDSTLRTITVTTPVGIANSGAVSLVFGSAAGLVNPSTATYSAKVRTGVEATNITTGSYVVDPAPTTITAPTVSVSPNAAETKAAYTVSFTVGSQGRLLAETSTIAITFPAATTVPASITPSTITVNGVVASNVVVNDSVVTITVPAGLTIDNTFSVTVVFNTGSGLFNPTNTATYTLDVNTSTETTQVTSNTYAINPSPTTTATATVIPAPGTHNIPAKYTFSFNTGGIGALQSGVSTITVTFPVGTTVPASIATTNVTVNGVNPSGVTTVPANRTVAATIPSGLSIGNNAPVLLVIGSSSSVLTSPTAGNYTAQVRTSVEQTDVTSNTYSLTNVTTTVDSAFVGPILGGASPAGGPSPQTVNSVAGYDVKFKLGADGGLSAGSSTITITFPAGTDVPTSIFQSLISVNGTTITTAPVCNAVLRTVLFTVPAGTPNIANDDTVAVVFSSSALLRNPGTGGTYRLNVRTSVEATDIPSKLYTIQGATTQVSAATVTPSPAAFGLNGQYRIDFSLGGQGKLSGGTGTITVTFPANTVVPSAISTANVTVNAVAAAAVVADSINRRTTITVPSSVTIPNNGASVLIFAPGAGLINPDPGSTTLNVSTSVETTTVASIAYTIESISVIQQKNKISLYPDWSPADTRIAYITESPDDGSGDDTGNWNLFTIAKDGSDKKQVTSAISGGTIEDGDPIHYSSFTWTEDGDSLVYSGYERVIIPPDTILTIQLFQIHKNGGAFKKISPFGAVEDSSQQFGGWLDPHWKLTLFGFEQAQFPGGVHRIAASIDGNIWVFEPRFISAFPQQEGGAGSTFKNLVQVTNLPTSNTKTDGLFEPKWSPDGRRLAVVYKDSSSATLSDIYVIANVDSIVQKTLESPNYSFGLSAQQFDYDTEVGTNAVNDLADMTKITPAGNTFPAWTPSWSTDGTQVAYSHDQANAFDQDTFSTSPKTSVSSTNFYVKLRNSDGTGPDSTLIGLTDANNAFPTMSNNGQRFGYFQAATTGPFLQKQKVLYLQTTGKFSPPATPKVLTRQNVVIWKLADYAYSSMEFPQTAVLRPTTFYIQEPQTVISESLEEGGRFSGVARTFGPENVSFLEPAVITIHYTDGELLEAGLVGDSGQEERLGMFVWNTIEARWQPVANSTVDVKRNLVSAPVTKLGTFGVFYQTPGAGQLFSQVMVYPNPFRPNSGSTNDGDYGTGVIFDLVPTGLSRLDVFNIAGEWVASIGSAAFEVLSPTQIRWRVTNDNNMRVASGIYIYIMEAVNNAGITERRMGKIGVIR